MSHRFIVRIGGLAVAALALGSVEEMGGVRVAAQSTPSRQAYQVVENYFKMPEGRTFGSTAAVDVDRDGRSIWIFERCGGTSQAAACAESSVAPILKFDSSGKVVKSFGSGMFANPHGIHVDKQGNVWVTDGQAKNGRGHQVFKFNADGKVLLTLGKAGVTGDGPDAFNYPSDVLVAPNGDVFVADGHGGNTNARIVKFSSDGKFIKAWGKKGTGAAEFDGPHSLAMDSSGRLFVADRGNSRIQIFDQDGKFVAEWKQFGRPSGIFIDKNDVLYAADTQSDDKTNPGFKRGIYIGRAADGQVTTTITDPDTDGIGEGVAADAAGNVYGALTAKQTLKKYVKGGPATK
jgi:sugar lactone lactonase YvrE